METLAERDSGRYGETKPPFRNTSMPDATPGDPYDTHLDIQYGPLELFPGPHRQSYTETRPPGRLGRPCSTRAAPGLLEVDLAEQVVHGPAIFASRIDSAFRLPFVRSWRCIHDLAAGTARIIRHAASENAP
jgi:hypothetical protein